jgi:hypothetical protein
MLIGFDVTTRYDCDVWFRVVLATSWSSGVFASLLLVLRGVALWARDRKVIVLAGTVWLTNLGGSIYGTRIITLFEDEVLVHTHVKRRRGSVPLYPNPQSTMTALSLPCTGLFTLVPF